MGREENRSLYSNSGALRVEIICRHTATTLGRKNKNKKKKQVSGLVRPVETQKAGARSQRSSQKKSGDGGCKLQLTLLRLRSHAVYLQLLCSHRFN